MKSFGRSIALMLTLCLISVLFGCAEKKTDEQNNLVGISIPYGSHGFMAAVAYYAEQEASQSGVEYKLLVANSKEEQERQADELIKLECGAIVLHLIDADSEAPKKVMDAKIPLILFDRKSSSVDADMFLEGDNEGMGTEGAKYIAEKLSGIGDVIVTTVATNDGVSNQRVDAFKNQIAKYPDINIIGEYAFSDYTKEGSEKITSTILAENPKIDAIFSIDDECSLGILKAIDTAKRTDIKAITGGGGAQEYFNKIMESEINLASLQYSPAMIKDCIKAATDLVKNKTSLKKNVIIPTVVIDKSNVKNYLNSNVPY